MGRIITVARNIRIRFKKRPFHLKNFYKFLHDWLIDEGYVGEDGKDTSIEKYYFEKRTKAGKEIWWWWRSHYDPDGGTYYRFHLDFDAHILTLKDTEIVRNGRKVKTNNGEIDFFITARLELDPHNRIKLKNPLTKKFFEMYYERWRSKDLDDYFHELLAKAYDLQNDIKQWFELPTADKTEKIFHPERGAY